MELCDIEIVKSSQITKVLNSAEFYQLCDRVLSNLEKAPELLVPPGS